jgi:hypothetical protein
VSDFWHAAANAVPGALASFLISGLALHYLKRYFDKKLVIAEAKQQERLKIRKRRSEAEQRRRRAEGRLLFWMHHAMVKPPPNGELEKAWEDYQEAEEAQKEIERAILAEYETGGGS